MIKTIKDIDINNKRVIIRCDFNVPIKDGKIVDDNRIVQSLPTIEYALSHNCKIILLSHLGRIKDESDLVKNNLEVVSERLSLLLNRRITFVNATRGSLLEEKVNSMINGDIILIQNTRYEDLNNGLESSNDYQLGAYWASLGDVFINDAFGTIHRAHASNVGIAAHLESGIGLLVEKELKALSLVNNPLRPYIIILGGAKVSDKIGVIDNLVEKADYILIGGGMAFTFLKAKGYEVGKSLLEIDKVEYCHNLLEKYSDKIILPVDVVVSDDINNTNNVRTKDVNNLEPLDVGLDVGEKTVSLFTEHLRDSKLVVWNGPLGYCEIDKFSNGTKSLLKFLADNNIKVIIGGGDTAAVVANDSYLKSRIYHISTGGGATIEYLEGKNLPGLEVLDK